MRGPWAGFGGFPTSLAVYGTCDVLDGTDDRHNRELELE
jgi:hypothetical protein